MPKKPREYKKLENLEELKNICNEGNTNLTIILNTIKQDFNSEIKIELLNKYNFLEDAQIKQYLYHLKEDINEIVKCNCGKECFFIKYDKGYNRSCCDKKCILEKKEETNLLIHGVRQVFLSPLIREKGKETMLEIYGVDHPSKSLEIQEKTQNTLMNNYGVKYTFSSKKIQEKSKQTSIDNYGVDNYFKSDEYKSRLESEFYSKMYSPESFVKRQQTKNETSIEKLQDKIKDKKLTLLEIKENSSYDLHCDVCNNDFHILNSLFNVRYRENETICTCCNLLYSTKSFKEEELLEFIKNSTNENIILNDRKILDGKEIDILVNDIGFEHNGLYWHSELFADKNYHLNKTNNCKNKGIQLIHIFEDEWDFKNEIVKSNILNILNKTSNIINSNNCEIKELEYKEIRKFINDNHILGERKSKINLGLFYNNELFLVMSFIKNEKNNDYYELTRFCTKLYTKISNGFEKLLDYFKEKYSPKSIIVYDDKRWSDGNFYISMNFNLIKETEPDYFWNINNKREKKYKYNKKFLIDKGEDKNKSVIEYMHENKYYRIYDCGNFVFELKL